MTNYVVNVLLRIHGSFSSMSSSDVTVVRVVILPFMPFPGLHLKHGSWHADIEDVSYDVETGEIRAFTATDKEIYEAELHHAPHRSINEIVQEYCEAGWHDPRTT